MQVIKQINNCEYFYKNYISAFKSQKKKEILHSSLLKKKWQMLHQNDVQSRKIQYIQKKNIKNRQITV